MRAALAALAAGAALLGAAPALADHAHCYWRAEGLPYSQPTPHDAVPSERSPWVIMYYLHMNEPHLLAPVLCRDVDEADIAPARERLVQKGCARDSSIGRMVESLPSGGDFLILPPMFDDLLWDQDRDRMLSACSLVKDIPNDCFRHQASGDAENLDMLRREAADCVDPLPELTEFGRRFGELIDAHQDFLGTAQRMLRTQLGAP